MNVLTSSNDDTVITLEEVPLSSLQCIHNEINSGSWGEYFVEGWNVLKDRHTLTAFTAIKVATAVGLVTATGFVGTSMIFAGLALADAIDIWESGGIPAVIGHWAEWSFQAVVSTTATIKGVNSVKELGRYSKINKIFDQCLNDPEISSKRKKKIYKEKLNFKAIQSPNILYYTRSLPDTSQLKLESHSGIIREDIQLQEVYDQIESALKGANLKNVKRGYQEIMAQKNKAINAGINIVFSVGALWAAIDFVVYGMGIVFSGMQAVEDLHMDVNPNVGGHTLEWTAEVIAQAGLIYDIIAEMGNVGKAKLITELFHEAIKQNPEHKRRLKKVMKRQFRMIPEGYFFRRPTHLLFNSID